MAATDSIACRPVDVLSEVVAAVAREAGKRVAVFFDGGIRRGSDLIVARALGASACFLGRATLYGVAAGGYEGARRAVSIVRGELEYALGMVGAKTWMSINDEYLYAGSCVAGPSHGMPTAIPRLAVAA